MTSMPGIPASGAAASGPPPPRRLRASDADRAAVVTRLQEAVGRGLLTLEEGDQRIAAAFAARYVDELGPLSADLPAPVPAGPAVMSWRELGESFRARLRHELRTTASSGLSSRRFVVGAVAVAFFVVLVLAMVGAVLHGLADPGDFHRHVFDRPR